jgi:ACS family tartrate transporter-like MFS transporter
VAFLDRVNISFAGLEMAHDLGFSDRVFGLGSGIFFVGYFLCGIPGAVLVERWSARRWIGCFLVTWGLVTILIAVVRTPLQFYGARLLLGSAEAGFFPGAIVYLTHWFRNEDRAKAAGMFFAAAPVANIIGSPVAGVLLGVRWFGLAGWHWLFVLEGIPAIALGCVTIFFLTDWPREANWLPAEEKAWIQRELQRENDEKSFARKLTIWEALRLREVHSLTLIYFLAMTGVYGFVFWFPLILKRASGLTDLQVTLLAALPYLGNLFVMIWVGWDSDRTRERRWHTAGPLLVSGVFLAVSLCCGRHVWPALASLTVVGASVLACMPAFWALATTLLSDSAAAAAVGLINAVGNLGGFAGPYVIGYLGLLTHSFLPGLTYLVASLFLGAALVLTVRIERR